MKPLRTALRRTDGITRTPFRRSDRYSENAEVDAIWTSKYLAPIREASKAESGDGRPCKYPREGYLGICIVAVRLGLKLVGAHRRVQTDDDLRAMFGYEPSSGATKLEFASSSEQEVFECRFPRRRSVQDFFGRALGQEWLNPLLDVMEEVTYTWLPTDALVRFGGETGLIAADSTRCFSPLRKNDNRSRKDDGALHFGRDANERKPLVRQKHSFLLTDNMMVIDGPVTTPTSEATRAVDAITRLVSRSHAITERAKQVHGLADPPSLIGAAIGGDSVYASAPFTRAAFEAGFATVAFPLNHLDPEIVGNYELALPNSGAKTLVELTSNHQFLCAHPNHPDREDPVNERPSMAVHQGQWTKERRFVLLECTDPLCPAGGARLYLSARKPDVLKHGGRFRGEHDAAAFNLLWSSNQERAVMMNHVATQAIERYHAGLQNMGLAANDMRGAGARVCDDLPNRFFYTLGDLLWNFTAFRNLGVMNGRENWDEAELLRGATAKSFQVKTNKAIGRAAREKRAKRKLERAFAEPDTRRTRRTKKVKRGLAEPEELAV